MPSAHNIEQWIFDVTSWLLVPVLIAILVALAAVIVELGRVVAEVANRRGRDLRRLERVTTEGIAALDAGDRARAAQILATAGCSAPMTETIEQLTTRAHTAGWDDWSAKVLADFDYDSMRRLERSRILVRAGPALGLMGTLIPLAPGLAALSRGDTVKLAEDLRIAFSVTILGLLVGAVAFGISLVRDRLYSQDLSDLEYIHGRARTHAGARAHRSGVMSSRVRSRAHSHVDRSGDPLDGLVNLFDLAIVLGVAFLLAALSALKLTGVLNGQSVAVIQTPGSKDQTIVVKNGSRLEATRLTDQRVAGVGTKAGIVYRLPDGRLVFVADPGRPPK